MGASAPFFLEMAMQTDYDEYGREIPDQTPVSVPAGWSRPVPLDELIRQAVRREISAQAVSEGQESFEEADDFDVEEDDELPLSQYEFPEGVLEMRPEPAGGGESLDGGSKSSDVGPGSSESEKSRHGAKKAVSGDSGQAASPDSGKDQPGK